jgi:hypothetical protein
MTDQYDDTYTTTSGLPLADADVEIIDFAFGHNPQIGGGLPLVANIKFRILEDGTEAEQSFSTGDLWEATGKGAGAQKNGGAGKQKFSSQSNLGRLIDSIPVDCHPTLRARGQLNEASTWIGLRFHTTTQKVTSTNPTTGEKKDRDAIVFSAFHGVGDDTSGAATSTPAPAGNGTEQAAEAQNAPVLDDALTKKLAALAKASKDHDTFMANALELPEVEDNMPAINAIVDSTDTSLYATAKG